MDDTTPQEAEEPTPPRDLRSELFGDLSARFSEGLESDGTLPVAAQEALVELLELDGPTADEIIAAASKNDSEEKDSGHE